MKEGVKQKIEKEPSRKAAEGAGRKKKKEEYIFHTDNP
jgi:hypothetical protein